MQEIEAVLGMGVGAKSSSALGVLVDFSSSKAEERDKLSVGQVSDQATLKGWDVWRAMEGM